MLQLLRARLPLGRAVMLQVCLGSPARSVANAAMMQRTEIIRSNRPPSASNLTKTRILLLLKPLVEVSEGEALAVGAGTVVVMMVMVVVVGAVEAVVAGDPLARMSTRKMRMGMPPDRRIGRVGTDA